MINNILVPTDFSDNAKMGLRMAIEVARPIDARITLLHVYQVRSATGSLVSVERFMRKDAEKELFKLQAFAEKQLSNQSKVDVRLIKEFSTVDVINKLAEDQYDLIVMGTKGASGLKEVLIGSIAANVLNSGSTPLIVVPTGDPFSYDKAVLCIDELPIESANIFEPLKTLTQILDSKELLVFHIGEKGIPAHTKTTIEKYFNAHKLCFHAIKYKTDIKESVIGFVKSKNAGLLCMIHRERSFLASLFTSSYSRKTAFDTPVPLLVITA